MDTVDAADKETNVVIVDLRHNDVLHLIRGLEIEATCHIHERNGLAAQRKQPINVRMCLGHGSHRHTCDDFAHLRDVDAVIHLAYAELDNFKLICSRLKQDPFSLFGYRICHVSLPLHVYILRYALYSPFGIKILP